MANGPIVSGGTVPSLSLVNSSSLEAVRQSVRFDMSDMVGREEKE